MKLADAHIHLFPNGYRHDGLPALFGAGELQAYEALRVMHGIGCALAIGYEASGIDPQNNAYVRRLATTHDWLSTVAYVTPDATPEPQAIQALLEQGHCGIALYVTDAGQARNLMRWPRAIWEVLDAHRAIVSVNAGPDATLLLRPLVEEVEGVPFLFSHLGLPGLLAPGIAEDALRRRLAPLLALASLQNAHVKLSGFYAASDPAFAYPHGAAGRAAYQILAAFGPHRCLWGSDFSPALEFVSFPQTVQWPGICDLPDSELDAVMRGNLVRILQDARAPARGRPLR